MTTRDVLPEVGFELIPIKRVSSLRYGLSQPPKKKEDGIPLVRATDIEKGKIDIESTNRIDSSDVPSSRDPFLSTGDILVVRSGANTGDSARIGDELAGAVGGYDIIVTPKRINSSFLAWCLLSNFVTEAQFKPMMLRAAQPHLNTEDVGEVRIPYPNKSKQQEICAFLDKSINKIDTLIEKKQRVIELLSKKRQATIRRKITRGVKKDQPLCETGVPWLEYIPERWTFGKVSWYFDVQLGKMLDEKQITGDHLAPYLRNQDVQWWEINTEGLPKMDFKPSDRVKYDLRPGDVLVCEGGEIGRSAVWKYEDIECYYQKALHRVRPLSKSQNPRYFCYFMEFAANNGVFTARSNKSTIGHLTAEKLKDQKIPVPPRDEQDEIVDELDQKLPRITVLQEKIEEQITYLQEKRQSFITKAVTGQIDLTDWQPPEEQELSA